MVLGHEESRNVLERKVPDSEDRRERGQRLMRGWPGCQELGSMTGGTGRAKMS